MLASRTLITSAEAAACIGIAEATLRTWRTRRPGHGPRAARCGWRVGYRVEDLAAWLARHPEHQARAQGWVELEEAGAIEPYTPQRLLTIDEVAELTGIAKATLYTWRTRRPGYGPPAVPMGTLLRFRYADVMAWIDARMEGVAA